MEISGKYFKEEHQKNIDSIFVTFIVFQGISLDKYLKDEHPLNILLISITLIVFHPDIYGIDTKDVQP